MRFESIEVDLDKAVEILLGGAQHFGVSRKQMLVLFDCVSQIFSAGRPQIVAALLVVGKDRGCGSQLGAHIGNGGLTGCRELLGVTEILDDGGSAAGRAEDAGQLENDVFGRHPARELALELDSDDHRPSERPRFAGHHFHCVGSAHADGQHRKTAGIGGVRVGTDHESTGGGQVLEDDLVNDALAWGTKADTMGGSGALQEVVDFLVLAVSVHQVELCTAAGSDQVIAVDAGWHCHLLETGLHVLQHSHLGGGILHRHSVGQ